MRGTLLAAALTMALTPASAQVAAPALSPECEAPAADIAAPAPLPHLAELLGRKPPSIRILAIGSSSTWGVGASSRKKTYPTLLRGILEAALAGTRAEIVNRGVSGEVAQTTAERLRTAVALDKPDLVLWQVGTNDALARVDSGDFAETLRSTIDWLKASDIDVTLVGLQYAPKFARDESYTVIREALRKVAVEENVLYVNRYDAMQFIAKQQNGATLMSPDELHENDLGYECLAQHIARSVIANLFVRRRDLPKPAPPAAQP
jgi:lysophospholipase L1-like esterase